MSSRSANRQWTAKQLIHNETVRELYTKHSSTVTPILIRKRIEKLGYSTTYMNCVNAHKRLKLEFFCEEHDQYAFLPSYIDAMTFNGHKAQCEVKDGIFVRLCIVYREGLLAYRPYAVRGLSIDGTFLKSSIGGTLLIACFRNGDGELQILGVAVVSIENEANWSFFLSFLLEQVPIPPSFVISDRDKGLVPVLMKADSNIHHFYCFRHLMENFNRVFKSKDLKKLAWGLARARTDTAFNNYATQISLKNSRALEWLLNIDKEKWSLRFSPCHRFGTPTSNDVGSINSALRSIRKLPILDSLLTLERYIAMKLTENRDKFRKWGTLTKTAIWRVDRILKGRNESQIFKTSSTSFIVRELNIRGGVPVEFAVLFSDNHAQCTCRYNEDMQAPCDHAIYCLQFSRQLQCIGDFYHCTWKTEVFMQAYSEVDNVVLSPPIMKPTLTEGICRAPTITKRRGRPKKKNRRESQYATAAIDNSLTQLYKSSTCGNNGHNKRRCPNKSQ